MKHADEWAKRDDHGQHEEPSPGQCLAGVAIILVAVACSYAAAFLCSIIAFIAVVLWAT